MHLLQVSCDNVKNIPDSAQWMHGSFYERFQDIVHKIVIVTLTNALLSVCINGNLEILMSEEIIFLNQHEHTSIKRIIGAII